MVENEVIEEKTEKVALPYSNPHFLKYGVGYESKSLWRVERIECLGDPKIQLRESGF